MAVGGLLFVSGQDPEAHGRLVYRGRIGRDLTGAQGRAALRLATLNALAVAQAAAGTLARVARCVALTAFVDATAEALDPALTDDAVTLVQQAFGAPEPPIVWLRPAAGLSSGMPVEVELLLELGVRFQSRASAGWRQRRPSGTDTVSCQLVEPDPSRAGRRSRACSIRGPYHERSFPSTR